MISLRLFNFDEDYEDMVSWVNTAGHAAPSIPMLPSVGALVSMDEKKTGCAFLYLATDCPVAFVEFLYFNPDTTPKEKHTTLKHLIKSLEAVAEAEKHPILFTLSKTNSMARIFKKADWKSNGDGYTQLMRNLEKEPCLSQQQQ